MSELGLLVLIATLALSGGVTAKARHDGAKDAAADLRAEEVRAEPAKQPAQPVHARREVIPLNTRGYNLSGPNDPAPAAIDEAPAAPVPTQR